MWDAYVDVAAWALAEANDGLLCADSLSAPAGGQNRTTGL